MKPLPAQMLTDEDDALFDNVIRRWYRHANPQGYEYRGLMLTHLWRESDERDAELMYYAQTNGKLGYVIRSIDPTEPCIWVRAPSAYPPAGWKS
jgi:hypothetical protein